MSVVLRRIGLLLALVAGVAPAFAQAPGAAALTPNLEGNIERPLRYRPDGADFVITNGAEFFNRPLYGGNTAFRVDAGDRPEFVLYLPGRGGNLRLGLVARADPSASDSPQRVGGDALPRAKWLHEAATIEARYRPGGVLYAIRDPLLGDRELHVAAYALAATEGLVVRVELTGPPPADGTGSLELVWAYGGVNGQRGRRDGDIGTESVPIGEWLQLRPEFCTGNRVEVAPDHFTLTATIARNQTATLRGAVPRDSILALGDATDWDDCAALLSPRRPALAALPSPVVTGRVALTANTPLFLGIQRLDPATITPDLDIYREVKSERPDPAVRVSERRAEVSAFRREDLPRVFAEAEHHFTALRERVRIETPDPYLNAAVGALAVAADAVWDAPQQAIMHGAVAWRTKLLGWRGPYALDALGWPERARANFANWLGRQNTAPLPAQLPAPDAATNLARSEAALHSNGDLSNSHYDMNLVFIDALFRHLLWTGDLEFAREAWPVIERHLAWERRLFRREFGPEKLPLYEAYAAIWASDDLQYSGGGATHATAYNLWQNRMAARLAILLGRDATIYQREAALIERALQELLRQEDGYAEAKDLLGRQEVHRSAGLWTFYHAADAGAQGTRDFAASIAARPRIPVRGPGVPSDDEYGMLPSTDWMPYTWSLNNVVMGENIHAALGLWQGGRPADAFRLLKSSLLASMFMGIAPGNVGSMNYLDVYRRESQRDFADGSGVLARALIEGLVGLRPDALAGELRVAPGWPTEWPTIDVNHPRVTLRYRREGMAESFAITPRFGRAMRLQLELVGAGSGAQVRVNGEPATAEWSDDLARWIVRAPAANQFDVEIAWRGQPARAAEQKVARAVQPPAASEPTNAAHFPQEAIGLEQYFNDRVTEIFRPGKYLSPRSPFVSLALPAQGIGYWAGHVNASAEIDDRGLRMEAAAHGGRLRLPNGVEFATPGPGGERNVLFTSQWDNYPREASLPLAGHARGLHLLLAGSTNAMQSRLDNGEIVVTYTDGTMSRLALRNPETWWPIEQDYFIDDYQFRVDGPLPTRVDLKTGQVRVLDAATFKGRGGVVPGGAATVLTLRLDPARELKALTVRALANDVVIGLMAATLER